MTWNSGPQYSHDGDTGEQLAARLRQMQAQLAEQARRPPWAGDV